MSTIATQGSANYRAVGSGVREFEDFVLHVRMLCSDWSILVWFKIRAWGILHSHNSNHLGSITPLGGCVREVG